LGDKRWKILICSAKNLKKINYRVAYTKHELQYYQSFVYSPTDALTWVLKENIIQKPLVFERKILTGIFGPTKENQTWRIKNNEDLGKLIKHENIVNYIKAQRLNWFGHIQRMPEARAAKKIFK
jgi:hypothetical protein